MERGEALARRWSCVASPESARLHCWITCLARHRTSTSRTSPERSWRWNWRTPAYTSCAHPCSIFWTRSSGPALDSTSEALGVAFGLREGKRPDQFLVALAVLSLLAEFSATQPLLCVIDDVQWLDRASVRVLTFVARRVLAEPIGLLFAVRDPSDGCELAGLPQRSSTVWRAKTPARSFVQRCLGRSMRGYVRAYSPKRVVIPWRCCNYMKI
jgi:hypothetical protein